MGEDEEDLLGFPWRGGADRETTGIMMWSKPFLVKLPSDEEVSAIFHRFNFYLVLNECPRKTRVGVSGPAHLFRIDFTFSLFYFDVFTHQNKMFGIRN